MAQPVAESGAVRLLIPFNSSNIVIAEIIELYTNALIDDAVHKLGALA